MKEIFKNINIRGLDYTISNYGNIYGKRGKIKHRLSDDGYLRVTLGKYGNRTSFDVHRLIALYFVKNDDIINKTEVNHKDLNRQNPKADNLEWISHKDNVNYSSNKGRYKENTSGLKNGRCTYNEEQIMKIRNLYNNGYTVMEIIKELFPSYNYEKRRNKWNTVKDICINKSFKNI